MQAYQINAAPLATVTGANVNTVQHSTKESQEALADPNHTTSDGARSNAVGTTEEFVFIARVYVPADQLEDQARGDYNTA